MPFQHEDSEDCPCGPRIELVQEGDSDDYVILHQRLADDDIYEGANSGQG